MKNLGYMTLYPIFCCTQLDNILTNKIKYKKSISCFKIGFVSPNEYEKTLEVEQDLEQFINLSNLSSLVDFKII